MDAGYHVPVLGAETVHFFVGLDELLTQHIDLLVGRPEGVLVELVQLLVECLWCQSRAR